MALPGKKGVGRSKAALILLCSVSFNRKHDCFFEDSPQKVPFFKLRLCTTSQAAHHQHEYVSCNGSHPSSQPLQLQPTVVKFPVNLADKYFCTESRFLMPFDYHKYSQNIWELQENMGKILSLILIVIMFVVQPKIGIIIFLSSLKLDFYYFFFSASNTLNSTKPGTSLPVLHQVAPNPATALEGSQPISPCNKKAQPACAPSHPLCRLALCQQNKIKNICIEIS